MIDRMTLDLRFDAHARMARAINGAGCQQITSVPMPKPRASRAALLVALAARLDPATGRATRTQAPLAPSTAA